MQTIRFVMLVLCTAVFPFNPARARGPIFADTNLLVAAAEKGHSSALAEVDAGTTYVTPNQYQELLNVNTQAQQKKRKAFLAAHHVRTFDGAVSKALAATADFK